MKITRVQIKYNISQRTVPIQNIIVHYTANEEKTASAEMHYNYFNGSKIGSSADIFSDDKGTWIINDYKKNYSWAIGDNAKYAKRNNKYNANSVHVEICVNGNTDIAIKHSQEIVAYLLKDLNLTMNDVYRHYDATSKLCPAFLIDDKAWSNYKIGVGKYMFKNYIEILNKETSSPQEWLNLINYIEGNPDKAVGPFTILKYLKNLVEKLGNG